MIKRRKGIAIVETPRGILVVAGRSKSFMLPGGGAERWESRKRAAIRELKEETGLKARKVKYLFRFVGSKWHNRRGRSIRNFAKVFLIQAEGHPMPNHEIKFIDYWKPGSKIKITSGTREVFERYLTKFKK